jgi:hypothetical protein
MRRVRKRRWPVSKQISKSASQRVSEKAPKRCFGAFCLSKKRIFPVIFRGQISRYGIFWAESFLSGIDFKQVKNNLQCLRGNLYPRGLQGVGVHLLGYKPGGLLTEQNEHIPDRLGWQERDILLHFSIVRAGREIICKSLRWGQTPSA